MSVEGLVNVPVSFAALVEVVRRHPGADIVLDMPPMRRREEHGLSTVKLHGVALDVETTGTDPVNDRIIQLALQKFGVDSSGRIVSTGRPECWLEDPGMPISQRVREITRLDDAMLKGKAISDGPAYSMLKMADVIVAHNSAFDRNFIERRLPGLEDRRWACSLTEVDWERLGFDGRKLKLIALEMGWRYAAHRADDDVNALLHVLDHTLRDGTTVLSKMLARSALPSWRLIARDAPPSSAQLLKDRGWHWKSDRRCWWREVGDDAVAAEEEWATIHVFRALAAPDRERLDATTRFRRW